jgi:hypothetical protein
MEAVFVVVLFGMLVLVGYAKMQQGVAKTPSSASFFEEEE